MKELIERLERATGSSFALDCAIFEAVLPTEWFGSKVISWFSDRGKYGCNTEDGYRHLECLTAPAYTASLDAALTLVPEGLSASVTKHGGGRGAAEIWRWVPERYALTPEQEADLLRRNGSFTHQNIGAATPALALCIAALRAREQGK